MCDRVCVSVTICGGDLERVMEAEGDAGFKCSSGTKCQKIIFIVMSSSKLNLSYFLMQFKLSHQKDRR